MEKVLNIIQMEIYYMKVILLMENLMEKEIAVFCYKHGANHKPKSDSGMGAENRKELALRDQGILPHICLEKETTADPRTRQTRLPGVQKTGALLNGRDRPPHKAPAGRAGAGSDR